MRSSLIASRVFFVSFIPLLLFGIVIWKSNGPSLLIELTEQTGGRAFIVENVNELPDIATKIGSELRNQYILG